MRRCLVCGTVHVCHSLVFGSRRRRKPLYLPFGIEEWTAWERDHAQSSEFRCDTCGRGYLTLNPDYKPPRCIDGRCSGGMIVAVRTEGRDE